MTTWTTCALILYHVLQVVVYSEQLSPVPAGRPPPPRAGQPRRVHQHLRPLHPPQLRDPHSPWAGDTGHAGLQGPNTGQVKVIIMHMTRVMVTGGAEEGRKHVPRVSGGDARVPGHSVWSRVPRPLFASMSHEEHCLPLLPGKNTLITCFKEGKILCDLCRD